MGVSERPSGLRTGGPMTPRRSAPHSGSDHSEHPCEAVLRAEYEARASGDLDAFARLLTDDVVWHIPGDNATSGPPNATGRREHQIAACWVLPEDQREFDQIWAEGALRDPD